MTGRGEWSDNSGSWLEWRRIVSGNKTLFATLTLVLACLTYAPAGAQEPGVPVSKPPAPKAPVVDPTTSEARIPFANQGGIYNWRAVNDRTLLIQAQNDVQAAFAQIRCPPLRGDPGKSSPPA